MEYNTVSIRKIIFARVREREREREYHCRKKERYTYKKQTTHIVARETRTNRRRTLYFSR